MNKNQNEINELETEIQELNERLSKLENNETEDEYDNMLDECTPEIKIGTLTYLPSQVLKNVDKIAYNCSYSEFIDEEMSELNEKIQDLKNEIKNLSE